MKTILCEVSHNRLKYCLHKEIKSHGREGNIISNSAWSPDSVPSNSSLCLHHSPVSTMICAFKEGLQASISKVQLSSQHRPKPRPACLQILATSLRERKVHLVPTSHNLIELAKRCYIVMASQAATEDCVKNKAIYL